METYWLLKHCDLFERLPPEELRALESVAQFRRFPAGSPVYLPSDSARAVLLLTSGRVKICQLTPDGRELILALIDPGELFGELALFDAAARQELAETLEPSSLVALPGEAVVQLLNRHPTLSVGITRLVGLRRRRIEQRLRNLVFQPLRSRLIHLLHELVERYGRPTPEGTLIDVRLSHQNLAAIVGSSRESVTLGLGDLTSEGLLRRSGRRLIVVDRQRLASEAAALDGFSSTPPPPRDAAPAATVRQHTARPSALDYNALQPRPSFPGNNPP
jgi:CRP-like cAMP-binding protein